MTCSTRVKLIAVAFVCVLYGAFCAAVYAHNFAGQPGADWMVFYTAARAYLDGNLPLLYDAERLTAHVNASLAGWLAQPLTLRPWLYPPTFLLYLIPFGLLPYGLSWTLFQLVTFAGMMAAIWCTIGHGRQRWLYALALPLAPAATFTIATGQNAFLTAGLLLGGFGLLSRRPAVAGMLLGLASYKPQFGLLAPVALLAARQWRALASAAATGILLALASVAVFGVEPWRVWVEWMLSPPPDAYRKFLECCRLHDESIYTNMVVLGASKLAADVAQVASILLAGTCVWVSWRRPMPRDLQIAVLFAAMVLAAPHVANYDTVLLVIAACIIVSRGIAEGFRRGELAVPVLVWAIQLFNPPTWFHFAVITPLLTCLLIACAIARARAAGSLTPAALQRKLPARSLAG